MMIYAYQTWYEMFVKLNFRVDCKNATLMSLEVPHWLSKLRCIVMQKTEIPFDLNNCNVHKSTESKCLRHIESYSSFLHCTYYLSICLIQEISVLLCFVWRVSAGETNMCSIRTSKRLLYSSSHEDTNRWHHRVVRSELSWAEPPWMGHCESAKQMAVAK